MTTQILPGIKAIGWIDCDSLQKRVDLHSVCGMPVTILTDIHPIKFFGEASGECQTSKAGGAFEDSATLTFSTGSELPRNVPLGFVVTDVNGISYLIGSLESPRPMVECARRTGLPSGDTAGFSYVIKHTAIRSMIPCII